MLTSGDVIALDLGTPTGREAGFRHPATVVTAQRILDAGPNVVQVVPLTSTVRGFHSEIEIEADDSSGLATTSVAQCQHIRSVAVERILDVDGNIGAETLARIRETIAVVLDLP